MTVLKRVSEREMIEKVGGNFLGYALPDEDTVYVRKGLPKNLENEVRNHELEHISKGEEGPFLGWGQLLGSVLPSLFGGNTSGAADRASKQASFNPYNVTSGFGTGSFDGTNATAELSAPYADLRNTFLGGAKGIFGAMKDYNPDDAASSLLGRYRKMSDPREARQRSQLENRLFKQGMLGSTGGGERTEALLGAQGTADLQRQNLAFNQAQQVQDQLMNRGMGFMQGATNLDRLPMENLRMGGTFGAASATAGANAAKYPWMAAQNNADSQSAFWGNIGQGVSSYFG